MFIHPWEFFKAFHSPLKGELIPVVR